MIQELTSQLARVDSLTREGKTSTLHFITREAADEERRVLERQNEALKQSLREKDQEIQKRDMTVQEHTAECKLIHTDFSVRSLLLTIT